MAISSSGSGSSNQQQLNGISSGNGSSSSGAIASMARDGMVAVASAWPGGSMWQQAAANAQQRQLAAEKAAAVNSISRRTEWADRR